MRGLVIEINLVRVRSDVGSEGGGGSAGQGGLDGEGGDGQSPRWRSGRIKGSSDYPPEARDAGVGGTVSVRYTVETDGHVTGCVVTRSSGDASLDQTTCRLIEQRFRYKPSMDAQGRPVPSLVEENHTWSMERVDRPPTP